MAMMMTFDPDAKYRFEVDGTKSNYSNPNFVPTEIPGTGPARRKAIMMGNPGLSEDGVKGRGFNFGQYPMGNKGLDLGFKMGVWQNAQKPEPKGAMREIVDETLESSKPKVRYTKFRDRLRRRKAE